MSLEQALLDNTAATRELIAVLKGGVAPRVQEKKPAPPQAEAPPVDRQTVARAVTEFARIHGREAGLAKLASFGAQRLPEVPDDKLAALLESLA